jgi:hypothetical protein
MDLNALTSGPVRPLRTLQERRLRQWKRGYRPRRTIGQAALTGALAGLAGGVAVMLARRLADRGVLTSGGAADADWEDVVATAARRRGLHLSPAQRTALGAAVHLAYSALLGALYGVGKGGVQLPAAAQGFLSDGLAYGAYLPGEGLSGLHSRRMQRRRERPGLVPVDTDRVFSIVTEAAFRALR